ncbi:MAG: hypothetical protein WC877_01900 [Dehalococcoidales bacterium]|jgi:hypothetical protein
MKEKTESEKIQLSINEKLGINKYNEDEKGIHYGFYYGNKISSEVLNDICMGDDLIYEENIEELKEAFKDTIREFCENNNLDSEHIGMDNNDLLDDIIDQFNNNYQNDYHKYRYEKDGYIIEYSNDSDDLIVIKSPYWTFRGFCSPCAPNGCYLGSDGNIPSYCLDKDFFDEWIECPYDEYFEVKDFKEEEGA